VIGQEKRKTGIPGNAFAKRESLIADHYFAGSRVTHKIIDQTHVIAVDQ
jgi:hypothetical protein